MSEENNNHNSKSILFILMEKGWPEKIKERNRSFQEKLTEIKSTHASKETPGWTATLMQDTLYHRYPVDNKVKLRLINGRKKNSEN